MLTIEEKKFCFTLITPIILSLLFFICFFSIKYALGLNLRNYINMIPLGIFLSSLVYVMIKLRREIRLLDEHCFMTENSKKNLIKYLNILFFFIIAGLSLILSNALTSWLFWNAKNRYLWAIVFDISRGFKILIEPVIIALLLYIIDELVINRIKEKKTFIHSFHSCSPSHNNRIIFNHS